MAEEVSAPYCPTCQGWNRTTKNMVCMTCGRDYMPDDGSGVSLALLAPGEHEAFPAEAGCATAETRITAAAAWAEQNQRLTELDRIELRHELHGSTRSVRETSPAGTSQGDAEEAGIDPHGEAAHRGDLSARLVFNLLSLVKAELPRGISITEVQTWDVAAWEEVAAWASAIHLVASDNDNDDVAIPPIPAVLR